MPHSEARAPQTGPPRLGAPIRNPSRPMASASLRGRLGEFLFVVLASYHAAVAVSRAIRRPQRQGMLSHCGEKRRKTGANYARGPPVTLGIYGRRNRAKHDAARRKRAESDRAHRDIDISTTRPSGRGRQLPRWRFRGRRWYPRRYSAEAAGPPPPAATPLSEANKLRGRQQICSVLYRNGGDAYGRRFYFPYYR